MAFKYERTKQMQYDKGNEKNAIWQIQYDKYNMTNAMSHMQYDKSNMMNAIWQSNTNNAMWLMQC